LPYSTGTGRITSGIIRTVLAKYFFIPPLCDVIDEIRSHDSLGRQNSNSTYTVMKETHVVNTDQTKVSQIFRLSKNLIEFQVYDWIAECN